MNIIRHSFKITDLMKFKHFLRPYCMKANISRDEENLEVVIKNTKQQFPLVWLRDNCTCESCYHQHSQSRIVEWSNFDINIRAKSVEKLNSDAIKIHWSDDHKSVYDSDWLSKRSFLKSTQEKFLTEDYRPAKVLWNREDFCNVMKKYDYKQVLSNDEILYDWLRDLTRFGVVLTENSPLNEDENRKLVEKIAFIRKTHYGEEFTVQAKVGTSNVAYLSGHLQLHTDLPYYHYCPGVTILHCLVQAEHAGGENLLTDAFYVADKLRLENKELFDILTTTEVNWSDIGTENEVEFHTLFRAPMISLDRYGNIENVRHSIPQRDSYFTVDLKEVKPWYRALKVFVDSIHTHAAEFKLKPGDMLAFDNTRLVHGRWSYQDSKTFSRRLIGSYVDWDEIYSKLRILKNKLSKLQ